MKRKKPVISYQIRPGIILIGGGILVLGISALVYFVTKGVRNRHNETAGNQAVSKTKKELKALEKQGIQPTMTEAEFEILSNQIHTSIRYSAVADDKGRAEALLKTRPQNQADVLALIKAYGKRELQVFGLPDGPAKDLPSAISEELSQSRIDRINRTYQSKGITFRF
ncbi:MAG: hypothetical protein AAFQ92_21435 [Bacteroidota bacterium]